MTSKMKKHISACLLSALFLTALGNLYAAAENNLELLAEPEAFAILKNAIPVLAANNPEYRINLNSSKPDRSAYYNSASYAQAYFSHGSSCDCEICTKTQSSQTQNPKAANAPAPIKADCTFTDSIPPPGTEFESIPLAARGVAIYVNSISKINFSSANLSELISGKDDFIRQKGAAPIKIKGVFISSSGKTESTMMDKLSINKIRDEALNCPDDALTIRMVDNTPDSIGIIGIASMPKDAGILLPPIDGVPQTIESIMNAKAPLCSIICINRLKSAKKTPAESKLIEFLTTDFFIRQLKASSCIPLLKKVENNEQK